jgi:hypothetical protein
MSLTLDDLTFPRADLIEFNEITTPMLSKGIHSPFGTYTDEDRENDRKILRLRTLQLMAFHKLRGKALESLV